MAEKSYDIAVVGATGAVGSEMIKIIEARSFPTERLVPLASEESLGREVSFCGNQIPIEVLEPASFDGIDIALFSAGEGISREFAPVAAGAGAYVIDNSSAFRMDADVPLVVPEVNPGEIAACEKRRIIANPNCSTIQMVMVLAPLHERARIRRVVVSTYQSVSGAGAEALDELSAQAVALFSQKECRASAFPHRIAFNCIPHIDVFLDDGSTKEELKLVNETRKIMGDDCIRVAATAVRVPVFYGHSEALNIEFDDPMPPEYARELLAAAPGVEVVDDPNLCRYPMAIDAAGKDAVFVGRIRRDPTVEHGLSLWIVADNLRKGAALNAVQIAELLVAAHPQRRA